jgi:hypothetical protein
MFGGHNTPSDADVHGLENFIWQEMNGCLISFRSQLSNYKKRAHCLWESGILIRGNLTTCACSCTLFIVRTMATKRNRSKAPLPLMAHLPGMSEQLLLSPTIELAPARMDIELTGIAPSMH